MENDLNVEEKLKKNMLFSSKPWGEMENVIYSFVF